jgi:hypothetical protein
VTGYTVVLPAPWERIPLDQGCADAVRGIVDRAASRLPKEVPPDQVAPARHRLERELLHQLREARELGGVDFYLPTDLMHGQQLNASFVVNVVVPDATVDAETVPRVVATLLAEEGARPVSAGGSVWVRTERQVEHRLDTFGGAAVEAADGSSPAGAAPVPLRRVQYRTGVPGEPRQWVVVTFTTAGDGDPASPGADLVVELFDAIMSTWRWRDLPDDAPRG